MGAIGGLYYGLQKVSVMTQYNDYMVNAGSNKRTNLMFEKSYAAPGKQGFQLPHTTGLASRKQYCKDAFHRRASDL